MNLQQLSDNWNALRNAALGRGLTPNASPQLANLVGQSYEQWRAWLAKATPIDDVFTSLSARPWITRYEDLRAMLASEQIDAPMLEPTLADAMADAFEDKVRGVAVVAVGLLALYIFANRRR